MVRKLVTAICDCVGKIYEICMCKEPAYFESIDYWKRIEHVDQSQRNDYFHKKG